MRERDKVFAVLWFDGEMQNTELTLADIDYPDYPLNGFSSRYDAKEHYIRRDCHFHTWEPGCCAGEILPVDTEHPANATLTWTWDNPEYKGA